MDKTLDNKSGIRSKTLSQTVMSILRLERE
uniref:Uncharacterized protein n=1 Tax=Myoviridae sp. ctIty1 TaxID=2827673 RepID=A0A8S5TG47_9CAUD|nr:MAG TPA: hypothetical protein [Myoviridae sp. ctIty1]